MQNSRRNLSPRNCLPILFLSLVLPAHATITITGGNSTAANDPTFDGTLDDGDVLAVADPGECGENEFNAPDYGVVITSSGGYSCSPADVGASFPVGSTTVECTSADDGAKAFFTVTVLDTQPPAVTVPVNSANETAPGQCSAPVNYASSVSVADNCPGFGCAACAGPTVSCDPPSGSTFNLGATNVTCVGTDGSGNKHTNSFPVIVTDQEEPDLVCPTILPAVVPTNNCLGNVDFNVTATDNCDPNPTVSCTPPSGSVLGPGQYVVRCQATDNEGNGGEEKVRSRCEFETVVLEGIGNVIWHAPVADGSAPGPGASHSDVPGIYRFKVGDTIPIHVKVVACDRSTDATGQVDGCVDVVMVDTLNPSFGLDLTEKASGSAVPAD